MGAFLMGILDIDHDRENNPDKEQVIEDMERELADVQESIYRDLVLNKLEVISLSKRIKRIRYLTFFLGRLEGEEFIKNRRNFK
jgi:hypothetical protein